MADKCFDTRILDTKLIMESGGEKKIDEPNEKALFIKPKDEKDSTHKSGTDKKNGCLEYVINILSVISIVQLIVLLTFTIIWYVNRVEDLAPREHEICLNCSQLTDQPTGPDALKEFIKKDGECCGTTSQILNRLVEKNTKEKYAKDLSNNFFAYAGEDCTTETIPEKAAAKIAGISFVEMKQDTSPLNIVYWNKTDPSSFFKAGLTYEKDRITILKAGMYYVFNQLKWAVDKTDIAPFAHQINRQVDKQAEHEVLLEGRKSKCNMAEESGELTSSVGALFEFDVNDEIFVTTSKPDYLVPCPHGNYFGLYFVAEKNIRQ